MSADENNLENENAAKAEDKNENDVEFVSNENTTEEKGDTANGNDTVISVKV